LHGADLHGADLRTANLRTANLSNANLSNVNLSYVDLQMSTGLTFAQCAFTAHGACGRMLLGVVLNREVRFFCGCFSGSQAELEAYIAEGLPACAPSRRLAMRCCLDFLALTVVPS
jgi:hypothetical protein